MWNKNVNDFLNGTVFYLKFVGFEFEDKHRWKKFQLIASLLSIGIVIFGQARFIVVSDMTLEEKTPLITFLNYYFVGVGKVLALIYNRKVIHGIFTEFRRTYPSEGLEKSYDLQKYRRLYMLIEKVLSGFFKTISLFYNGFPLVVSLIELGKVGSFTFRTPLMCSYPVGVWEKWSYYALDYFLSAYSTYMVALIILGLDLCLFSSLLQLCMHFDVIRQNILLIEPDGGVEAERRLKEQIVYHELVLRLSDEVNSVFTPSVLFSLFSSSFILCFTGYQLLGDISPFIVFKAIFLLGYEMKQVVITCLLSDKLIEISESVANSVYEHKWYNGTPRYKRLILVMLLRSQRSAALNLAGIAEVSRQTLRKVMSVSYQIFTVLKTK